jgi:cGMP-dependent protein kinase 2
MALLKPRGSAAAAARPRANIRICLRLPGKETQLVEASGHLDEVVELARGGTKLGAAVGGASAGAGAAPGAGSFQEAPSLMLVEAALLGEGAFSRVSEVTESSTQRVFALKRMAKTAAVQCPEHVYCEQHISKNAANPFCMRQYASFKVRAGF